MDKISRIKDEISGVLSILVGLVVFISLVSHNPWDPSPFIYRSSNATELKNMLGPFGSYLSDTLLQTIGFSAYILPVILVLYGLKKVFGKTIKHRHRLLVFIGVIVILILSVSSLLVLILGKPSAGNPSGGTAGFLVTKVSLKLFSTIGSYILFIPLMLVTLMYLVPFSIVDLAKTIKNKTVFGSKAKAGKKEKEQPHIEELTVYKQEPLPLMYPVTKTKPLEKTGGTYELPHIELLKNPPPSKSRPAKEYLLQMSNLLEKKLQDFSIEGKVTYVSPGPVVTMFEFKPAPGIKINKVVSLSDDLAMALKANRIRISPIHGRATLGVEVPNKEMEDVFLRDIISSDVFKKSHPKLTLALGKDIFGTPVTADLSRMPHLLIAGATGAGKSVGLNSIVLSLLYRATPKEMKLLMIDPKMLEFSAYEEIPHLLMPVLTLPKDASDALKKLVFEMERRYRLLAETGSRNIEAYNKKLSSAPQSRGSQQTPMESDREPLPYIVIIIDELADLMFVSAHEVEDSIARLAQMARAAGIHLILATQRPSVDVITGIIKANFPSRISFQVSSKVDSRIILDTYGAEQLIGKGDMLFVSPGKKTTRVHGAYVSEEEIRDVVDFIKAQAGPDYTLFEDLTPELQKESDLEDRDELYQQAKGLVLSTGQASISYIQRRMKIGYNRAARIMETLEEEGVVGPPGEAGKPREIFRRGR